MALSDTEIWLLAKKMDIPLAYVGYKDNLRMEAIKSNKSYIINLQDEDDDGNGSHWTCFQINKIRKNNKDDYEAIYFDSTGMPPPEEVKRIVKKQFNKYLNYTTKNVQSIVAGSCGYWVLAFLHWINVFDQRTKNLFEDTMLFLDLFDDLNYKNDHTKNEFILKHFFLNKDPKFRKMPDITDSNTDMFKDYKLIDGS